MKKVILFSIPAILVLIYWTEIVQVFNNLCLFLVNPIVWKINPIMIGTWVVYKFHKYLWSNEIDFASGEKIGEYNSLNEAEFKTKQYAEKNYSQGFITDRYETQQPDKSWKYTDFAIKVIHTVCVVIFVPIKK